MKRLEGEAKWPSRGISTWDLAVRMLRQLSTVKKDRTPLVKFLNQASRIGTLESESAFTIAGDAAISKLASFRLPRRSAWILKVVQAAVAAEASELRITQSNKATTFTCDLKVDFQAEEFRESMLDPEAKGPRFLGHLATGLRSVGFGEGRAFTLALHSGKKLTLFAWGGKQLTQCEEALASEADLKATLKLSVAFPPQVDGRSWGGLKRAKGLATTEFLEVVQNAEACPLPLYFDSRRLDTLMAPPPEIRQANSVSLSVGWPSSPISSAFPTLGLPRGLSMQDPKWRPSDDFIEKGSFLYDGDLEQAQAGCIVKLRYTYRVLRAATKHSTFQWESVPRPSFIRWVKDGVVIDSQRANVPATPVSYDVYLSADDLSTDLSGFKLQKAQNVERRLAGGTEQVKSQAKKTIKAMQDHAGKPVKVPPAAKIAGAIMVAAAPFTGGMSLVFVFCGGLLVLALNGVRLQRHEVVSDCLSHLQELAGAASRLRAE